MEQKSDDQILTIHQVAEVLQCSKTHVSNVLGGKVRGLPPLPHVAIGRRKLIRRQWLDAWMEAQKSRC